MYILLLIFILACAIPDTKCVKKSSANKIDQDDDLFPIYKCDTRTRDWTQRCLVQMTNAQLSLDLCRTGEKPDQPYVQRCVRQLKAIGKSCPQPAPVADIAKDMMMHNPPPPPSSPNAPKLRKAKKEKTKKLDKPYDKDVLSL
uniref:Putative proline rich salivary secreted peptide n=1 Tax=Anopheles darlingi TaxID=43151 RepID=A0A2M4DRL0_ANODA